MPSSATKLPEPKNVPTGPGVVVELVVEAPLHDVLRVEVGARGVVAVGVDGEDLGQLGDLVHVPRIAVGVGLAVRGRRVRQVGLVEQLLVVVHHRGEHAERQRRQLARLLTPELDLLLASNCDRSKPVDVDQRLEVEELAGEGVRPADPDRADDVRRVAAGDLRRQVVEGDLVVDDLDLELDLAVVALVEVIDHVALGGQLLGLGAGAEPDVPPHDGLVAGRLPAAEHGLDGRRRRRRGGLGCGAICSGIRGGAVRRRALGGRALGGRGLGRGAVGGGGVRRVIVVVIATACGGDEGGGDGDGREASEPRWTCRTFHGVALLFC